jgi:hypothetical protein
MKNILKLSLIGLVFLLVGACENTELEELLDNPNSVTPENAEIDLVFNNVMLQFENFIDESSDETMPYTRMMAMADGNQYNTQDAPTSFDFLWEVAYARLFPDIDLVIELGEERGATTHQGIAKIIRAYVAMTMVDLFGDIPYSEATRGVEFQNPAADSGQDIYVAALGLLEDAIEDLGKDAIYPTTDLFYESGSDADRRSNWIKVANSLIIRAHVTTKQAIGSAAVIEGVVNGGNFINEPAEDMAFHYGLTRATPDSRHPYYTDGYDFDGMGVYLSNQYMWFFFGEKETEDPRLRYYFYRQDCDENGEDLFTLDCPTQPVPFHWASQGFIVPADGPWCTASLNEDGYGGYWGRDHGNDDGIPPDDFKRTAYGLYPAGGKFDNDACADVINMGTDGAGGQGVAPVIMSSYMHFYLAEAALTMNANVGSPRDLLEAGVRLSIETTMSFGALDDPGAFEPSDTQIEDYVAEVLAAYDAAGDDEGRLDVIMKEFHLALWGQGVDAYNNYRRTALPSGLQPTREPDSGDFPRLMWYPSDYVNLNSNATQRVITEQVFWDKLPAGAIR